MHRIILAASLALLPAGLLAQTCMGAASFADRHAQIGADASVSDGARSALGGAGIGSRNGPFASVAFGRAHDNALDDDASLFSATAGINLALRPIPKTHFCPFISAEAVNGVEFDNGDRMSSQAFTFGTAVGTRLTVTRAFDLVPFVAAAQVTRTNTIHVAFPIYTRVTGDDHRFFTLGMGFVLMKVLTIRPSTTFTVAGGRTTRSSGVHLSFGFFPPRARRDEGPGSLITVWLNPRTGTYYCPGSRLYGGTEYGRFTTERAALESGAAPEFRKRCH